MRTLSESQALLQAFVTHPVRQPAESSFPSSLGLIQETSRFDAAARLEVYSGSYRNRLLECAREFFPCLEFALGSEMFHWLATDFLVAHPPRHPNLSRLVDGFPDFLQSIRSRFEDPEDDLWPDFLIELAQLEVAFYGVYNAVGPEFLPPFSLSDLADGPETVAADLCLAPSPCLRLMAMQYPTAEFFTDFRTGKRPRFPTRQRTFVALSRRAFNVDITQLNGDQHGLMAYLMNGLPVRECLFTAPGESATASSDVVCCRWDWISNWVDWRMFVGGRRHS